MAQELLEYPYDLLSSVSFESALLPGAHHQDHHTSVSSIPDSQSLNNDGTYFCTLMNGEQKLLADIRFARDEAILLVYRVASIIL